MPESVLKYLFNFIFCSCLAFSGSCMVASLAWAFFLGKTLPMNYDVGNGVSFFPLFFCKCHAHSLSLLDRYGCGRALASMVCPFLSCLLRNKLAHHYFWLDSIHFYGAVVHIEEAHSWIQHKYGQRYVTCTLLPSKTDKTFVVHSFTFHYQSVSANRTLYIYPFSRWRYVKPISETQVMIIHNWIDSPTAALSISFPATNCACSLDSWDILKLTSFIPIVKWAQSTYLQRFGVIFSSAIKIKTQSWPSLLDFTVPLSPLHALSFFTTLSSRSSIQLAASRFQGNSAGGPSPSMPLDGTMGVVVNQVELTKIEESHQDGEYKFPRTGRSQTYGYVWLEDTYCGGKQKWCLLWLSN